MAFIVNFLQTAGLILIGVLLFELIIFFHEGGHFICAKLSGIKVNEFSLGMGPKLFSFTKGETKYSLRLLPIGGFCAMEGEDEDSNNPRAFNNAKVWKRLLVIVAGAVMNIILGLIFMAIILSGSKTFLTSEVNYVRPDYYSSLQGLQEGDVIYSINGYKINNQMDLNYSIAKLKVQKVDGTTFKIYKEDTISSIMTILNSQIGTDAFQNLSQEELDTLNQEYLNALESAKNVTTRAQADKVISDFSDTYYAYFPDAEKVIPERKTLPERSRFRADIIVLRDGKKVELPDFDFYTYTLGDDPTERLGIDFSLNEKDNGFFTLVGETASQTTSVVRMVVDSLVGLVKGEFGFNDVSGPVGATTVTVEAAQAGLEKSFLDAVLNIMYIMMVITVNLGVVNMLPFPALDGGRFIFLLIEAIFKKPIPRKVEAIVNAVGLCLLLTFMFVITIKDVWVLIK